MVNHSLIKGILKKLRIKVSIPIGDKLKLSTRILISLMIILTLMMVAVILNKMLF